MEEYNKNIIEEKENHDVIKYVLKKPIHFEGKEIKELNFNFEDLTGKDLRIADTEARAKIGRKQSAQAMTVPEINPIYLCCVAARASNQNVDMFFELKAKDYSAVKLMAQDFLLTDEME